jgi:thiol-disulfide isomerase/thioredoxin
VPSLLAAAILGAAPVFADPPLGGVFAEHFTLMQDPAAAPDTELGRLDGTKASLADFRGEVVLLNFWATWCAPCLREMPSLERLQVALEDQPFRVVAVSTDRGGAAAVKPFLKRLKLDEITVLLDARSRLAADMGLRGLPTTYVLDHKGRVVGGMEGPAEWDSPDARALVEHYLEGVDPPQKAEGQARLVDGG